MDNKACGSLIKSLRKERNLTQKQLADMLAVSQTPISRWENGEREISIYMLEKIAKVFDMTMQEFVGMLENGQPQSGTCIIVVEDVPSQLKGIISVVKEGFSARKNLNVNGFSTYEEALDFCRDNHVNIAFLDIELQEKKDGFKLAREIKELHPDCLTIILTGHPEYAAKAWDLHSDSLVNAYILKPLTVRRLKKEFAKLSMES